MHAEIQIGTFAFPVCSLKMWRLKLYSKIVLFLVEAWIAQSIK